jgi:hypothetical protein
MEMRDLLNLDGNEELTKWLEGQLLVYCTILGVALVYLVIGADVLEGKIQEAGMGEVGRCGMEDLLMGMARRNALDPLLVDPFIVRGPQAWSSSSMMSTRTSLMTIMVTTRGGGLMPICLPGSDPASPLPNVRTIWT